MKTPFFAVVLLLAGALLRPAMARDFDLTFARHEVLESKVMGETRDILVAVPDQLAPGLPLLVLLDGEWNMSKVSAAVGHLTGNGRLPPMVVAGVVNTDRGRDMIPAFAGGEFTAGPADRFLSFLADELIPHLAVEYPIGKYHILAGHSNAGEFALFAFVRRPEVFQATVALSPSFGLDDRFQALVAGALARPAPSPRFVFLGAGGDEEADTAVGTLRFAKTFESAASTDLEWHYVSFPGETHGSVVFRAFYGALECLGQPDAVVSEGPARLLSEAQRRRHAWVRRFGSAFNAEPLPLLSVARPLLERLAVKDRSDLAPYWERLRAEHGTDFRFDPVERRNLLQALEARGRPADAALLRALPGFATDDAVGNNYGTMLDLKAGLVAQLLLDGSAVDLCHPDATAVVHGALPCPDRHGREGCAFRFNGKNDFIEFPWNQDYSTAGSVSVSAWIRPHEPAAYTAWISLVRTARGGSQWRLGFGPNPATQWGATSLATRWTDYWATDSALPVDRWVHTAAVFDQTLGELHLYVDGREVWSTKALVPWCAGQGPLLVGAQRDDGLFYAGDVGEVRVYRRTLSVAEVAALGATGETAH